jgi:hypothetical protein
MGDIAIWANKYDRLEYYSPGVGMRPFTIGVSVISLSMTMALELFLVATPSAAVPHRVAHTTPAEQTCIGLETAMSCDQKSPKAH